MRSVLVAIAFTARLALTRVLRRIALASLLSPSTRRVAALPSAVRRLLAAPRRGGLGGAISRLAASWAAGLI
jgi:hypothetical protein